MDGGEIRGKKTLEHNNVRLKLIISDLTLRKHKQFAFGVGFVLGSRVRIRNQGRSVNF
jgi:hypothetical protein